MALSELYKKLPAQWTGTSTLNLGDWAEGQSIFESPSTLSIALDPLGKYATVDYTWSHDGADLSGHVVFSLDGDGKITGAWMDSWHQSGAVMHLEGPLDDAVVRMTGNYTTTPYEDWRWRLELESPVPGTFELRMINIAPDGKEEWAVKAEYKATVA